MKQETRNKRQLILLGILVAATTAVFWLGQQEQTLAVDKDLYRRTDLKTIDRVVLKPAAGRPTVELAYNGTRWQVNGQHDADRQMIDVLFATLQQMEPKRPVSEALRDSLQRQLTEQGVLVSLYREGQEQDRFYAGGNATRTQAYLMYPGETPYLMNIPGYRVYVSGIFEEPEGGWRNKYIFGFNWRNFQALSVFFAESQHDFSMELRDQQVVMPGVAKADTAKVNGFLDAISLLRADTYEDNATLADSLKDVPPLMRVVVKDIANREYELRVFPPQGQKCYGLLGDGQLAVFPEQKIRPLYRPKEFFSSR